MTTEDLKKLIDAIDQVGFEVVDVEELRDHEGYRHPYNEYSITIRVK